MIFECTQNDKAQLMKVDKQFETIDWIQENLDEEGKTLDQIEIQLNLNSNITELTYLSNDAETIQGVVIGALTQAKLEKFSELGVLAMAVPNLPDTSGSGLKPFESINQKLFDSLDVEIDKDDLQQFNGWFHDLDPILIVPYLWDKVDASLEKFWNFGNDETLAAFDLGNAIEDANWRPDFWADDWIPTDIDPWFTENSASNDFSFPDPVFDFDQFGSNPNADIPAFGGTGNSFFGNSSPSDFSFSFIDPLVLKIGGGAVHTTNLLASKVSFDMNGDGTKEKTGWITADHAFLVRDKNNNGKVDGISEMFSEQMSVTSHSGFGALAELDTKRNGRIDKNDKAFGELRLWTDINVNGFTDAGELHKLSRFGIQSIDLNHVLVRNQYDNGNMVLGTASYTAERKGKTYTGEIAEVLFNFGDHAPLAHIYLSDQASALRTANGKVIEVLHDKSAQKANASLSGVNVLIGASGDVLNAGNAGQSLLIGNGGATLNGNHGAVHFIVNGSQNIVNTGSGESTIDVLGDANTINAGKGDVVMEVAGSRNKISIGSSAEVAFGGTSNTLTAATKSKDNQITISGNGHVVTAGDADIELNAHSGVTLNGKNNHVVLLGDATLAGRASGGTLTAVGDGNAAVLSDAFVAVTEGASLALSGSKQQVVLAGDASLVMASNAKDSTIFVFGEDNHVKASKTSIQLDEGAGLALDGTGSKITLTGNAEFTSTGTGHVIDVYRKDNEVQVDRSTVNEHRWADLTLNGLGNVVKVPKDSLFGAWSDKPALEKIDRSLDQAWLTYLHTVDQLPVSSTARVEVVTTLVGIESDDGQMIPVLTV